MNFSWEKFEHLMAQAEEAAASFDGKAIAEAMRTLTVYMDDFALHATSSSIDPSELQAMRGRLERYQKLCVFLQQTLRTVLSGALNLSAPPGYHSQHTSYGVTPRNHPATHCAPLIRRYC